MKQHQLAIGFWTSAREKRMRSFALVVSSIPSELMGREIESQRRLGWWIKFL
jgi:hypothetical protein